MVGLSLYQSHLSQKADALEVELHRDWIENIIPREADLIDALLQDVTPERTLILFQHGTVAIVSEPSTDPKKEALEILKKNASSDSIFAVNKVDQDYAIRYQGPLFTRLSGKAVSAERKWISKNWKKYLTPAELKKIEQSSESPDFSTQVGLISRSFLLRDLADLKVTKILKAKPASSEEPQQDLF